MSEAVLTDNKPIANLVSLALKLSLFTAVSDLVETPSAQVVALRASDIE